MVVVKWEPFLKNKSGIKIEGDIVKIENKDIGVFESQNAVTVVNELEGLTFAYTRVEAGLIPTSTEIRIAPNTKVRERGNVGLGTPDILLTNPRTAEWKGGTGDGEEIKPFDKVIWWAKDNWILLMVIVVTVIIIIILIYVFTQASNPSHNPPRERMFIGGRQPLRDF